MMQALSLPNDEGAVAAALHPISSAHRTFGQTLTEPNQHKGFVMPGSSIIYARKRHAERQNNARTLTKQAVKKEVAKILAPLPAKTIAKASGSSIPTAENARQGHHAMSLPHFLNACREIPELRALAMELMGLGEEFTDPDFHRGIHHLVQSYIRRDRE